jgi:hypothetical protein
MLIRHPMLALSESHRFAAGFLFEHVSVRHLLRVNARTPIDSAC